MLTIENFRKMLCKSACSAGMSLSEFKAKMNVWLRFCFFFLFFLIFLLSNAQNKNEAYLTYIEKYSKIAQKQQKAHGIPASITLAQGLLESGAGNSLLTVEANNHFGIKCHTWEGETFYQDDDELNECFRKYRSAGDSFEDHSAFLMSRSRYAELFTFDPTDYKSWARGLKKAGYATDPAYADKLISIIEIYELHEYDTEKVAQPKVDKKTGKNVYKKPEIVRYEHTTIGYINAYGEHKTLINNGAKYVFAVAGDTYGSIADEFRIAENKLRHYNDVDKNTKLQAGDIVYLQSKKNKAAKNCITYMVQDGDSMYSIAQDYGIKLESLYKINAMPFSAGVKIGQILKLR